MASSIRTLAHYRNVIILTFSNLVVMFGFSMFAPMMSVYMLPQAGGSLFIIGLYISMFALPRALLQPFTGRLSDRIGRKKTIVPALFSYSFVALLYSTATSPIEFISYRAVQGVSSSTLWPASDALIADTVPTQVRARALGAVSMTYQVGTLIAPALGGIIAYIWGLQEVFYFCALLAIAGAISSLLFLREPIRGAGKQQAKDPVLLSDKKGINPSPKAKGNTEAPVQKKTQPEPGSRRRIIAFLVASTFIIMITFSMIDTLLAILIVKIYGGTYLDIGLVYMLFGLTGALAAVTGGTLADKYGKRKILLISAVSGSFFWLGMLWTNTLMLLAAVIGGFAFIATMAGPATSALIADLTPPERRGSLFGILGMFNDLGMFVGPIAGGLLVDFVNFSLGRGLLGGMQSLFMMNALVTVIAVALVAIGVKEPKTKS